jgi:hypothetical protein
VNLLHVVWGTGESEEWKIQSTGGYRIEHGRGARYLAFYSTRGTSDLGVRLRNLDFVFLWKQVCSSRKRVLDVVEEPSDFQLWIRETEGEKTKKQSC